MKVFIRIGKEQGNNSGQKMDCLLKGPPSFLRSVSQVTSSHQATHVIGCWSGNTELKETPFLLYFQQVKPKLFYILF